jgi:hypothetical protein
MTEKERLLFSNLLFTHKHLLTVLQVYRYMIEHPETDYETAQEAVFEEIHDVYTTLADALVMDTPLEEPLDTVITHSHLIEVEIRNSLKGRRST